MFDRLMFRPLQLRLVLWLLVLLTLSLSGLLWNAAAHAGDLATTWTHPTQFEDGSPLALAQIASTRVEWGSCSGTAFGTKLAEAVVPAPATSYTVTGLAPGTYCLRAYTRTTAAAGGLESAPTGVVQKVIPFQAPKPPVFVTVNVVAYEVLPHPIEGTRLGRNVGSVPLGTACGTDPVVQTFGGTYYEVPLEAVTLTKAPRSAVVVARCEASG